MDTQRVLKQLYLPAVPQNKWQKRKAKLRTSLRDWIAKRTWKIVAISIMISGWSVSHLYYYNQFVILHSNVLAAQAQIEAASQRRRNTQRNLLAVARAYLHYEERILTAMTDLRTGALAAAAVAGESAPNLAPAASASETVVPSGMPSALRSVPPPPDAPRTALPGISASSNSLALRVPAAPAADLHDLMTQIKMVGEQYPDLKATQNLQQIATATIATEAEVDNRVVAYNQAVNEYSTMTGTFPGNLFAKVSGFGPIPFYQVEPDALLTHEVSF